MPLAPCEGKVFARHEGGGEVRTTQHTHQSLALWELLANNQDYPTIHWEFTVVLTFLISSEHRPCEVGGVWTVVDGGGESVKETEGSKHRGLLESGGDLV